jgi:LmbE family N-acetylglucosaminyl deacetylase
MAELRLLACFAHPDDEAFPVGGALAFHAQKGTNVRLITATSGEEGDIRSPGIATTVTLGAIRRAELHASANALGIQSLSVLGYRDSGMVGSGSNDRTDAFINIPGNEVVEKIVREIRSFKPQVVLTFEPGGLYGHPDHIAICKHTTEAFHKANDQSSFIDQITEGLEPFQPLRLFYSARPQGFRTTMALKLREAGIDFPLPNIERANDGMDPSSIQLEMDVSSQLDAKMACIQCHKTQVAPNWPYNKVPRAVSEDILGVEHYIRAWPELAKNERLSDNFFEGIG